jgi:hypothetical protein
MTMTLLVHIIAGSVGLLSGFVAISAAKGARLHRRSGLLFVGAIMTMGVSGAAIAALASTEISVIAGMTTAYLAFTGYRTVRRLPAASGRHVAALRRDAPLRLDAGPRLDAASRLDAGATLVGLILGVSSVSLGVHTLAFTADGMRDGLPAFPFFIMGLPALIGGVGDIRLMRIPPLDGTRRLNRHLWRMCYALFIASMSFFLGQADEIPEALRITPVLVLLAFLPALVMFYWLWRVRSGRSIGRMRIATHGGAVEPDAEAAPASASVQHA